MQAITTFLRFQRLSPQRRKLLIRCALLLAGSSIMVAAMPFRRAIRFGSVPLRASDRSVSITDCLWAIDAAAKYLPLRTVCIEKGLAAQRLFRKMGIDARLHYGANSDPVSEQLAAHVWVSLHGEPLVGGQEAPAFAEIASYP